MYIDSSALIKMLVEEPESDALQAFIAALQEPKISSRITEVEVMRAASRAGGRVPANARVLLQDIGLLDVDEEVLGLAASLGPPNLRTLDAIHLASAVSMRGQIRTVIAYDRRLLAAAKAEGLSVVSPSA